MATPTPHLDPDLLSAYLDEEVTAAERARVEAHLTGCTTCRAELEGLLRTVSLLRALPVVPTPRTFYVTEAMIEPERATAPRWLPAGWRQWLGGLATVATLLLCMVVVQLQGMGGLGSPVAVQQQESMGAAESEMAAPAERAAEESEPPQIAMGEDSGAGESEGRATEDYAEGATGIAPGTATTLAEPPLAPAPVPESGAGQAEGEPEVLELEIVSPTLTLPPTVIPTIVVATEEDTVTLAQATPPPDDALPVATPAPPTPPSRVETLRLVALALLLLVVVSGVILWRTRGTGA